MMMILSSVKNKEAGLVMDPPASCEDPGKAHKGHTETDVRKVADYHTSDKHRGELSRKGSEPPTVLVRTEG